MDIRISPTFTIGMDTEARQGHDQRGRRPVMGGGRIELPTPGL